MLEFIKKNIQTMQPQIKKILKKGTIASISIAAISAILLAYYIFYPNPEMYYIGLAIMQFAILIYSTFLVCGFAFEQILREIQ